MNTYVAKVQLGNSTSDISPIASTMFGICNSRAGAITKVVNFAQFDNLIHGVTIYVKFTYGCNTATGIKLQVGNTLAQDILGDCTCGANEVIAFTFEEINGTTKYWHANTAGISASMRNYITDLINTTVDTPNVLIFKGTLGIGGNPGFLPDSGYSKGWLYYVITSGTYAGVPCEVGDLLLATADAASSQTINNPAHWTVIQNKKQQLVIGPNSSTDGHVVVFDGNSGTNLQDSGFTIASSVPANAVFTDTTYTNGQGLNLRNNEFSVDFNEVVRTNDVRLSDARAPLAHSHGNIDNDGVLSNANNDGLIHTINGEIVAGPAFTSDTTRYLNSTGTWSAINFPVTTVNGLSGDVWLDIPEIDVNAMHFVGVATSAVTDGGIENPNISNYNIITDRKAGDVIIVPGNLLNIDYSQEFIWSGDAWEMLGSGASATYTCPTGNIQSNTWINSITQNSDRVISATTATLDTTGTWEGNAATATQLASPISTIVNIETTGAAATATISGNEEERIEIGISGILNVANGGTGTDSFLPDEVILSDDTDGTTLVSRAYSDSTSAEALLSNSNNFVTERDIYFGLPFINNEHNYTSATTLFAPTEPGTRYQLLISNYHVNNNTTYVTPEWSPTAYLYSELSNNTTAHQTILELGNDLAVGTTSNSEGQIKLYSAGQGYHILSGANTNSTYSHILSNSSGIIVQTESENTSTVGSPTNPVWVDNGTITALRYAPNRLYYSSSTTSFSPTGHYANDTTLAINSTNAPNTGITLYVNGNSSFNGTLNILSQDDNAFSVAGGATITKSINIHGSGIIDNNFEVSGATTLNTVGIGQSPESGVNAPILAVTGNALFKDDVTINGTFTLLDDSVATSTTGALVTAGGISIGKNLYVNTTSTLIGQVGIGIDTVSTDYILAINGDIEIVDSNIQVASFNIDTQTIDNDSISILNFIPSISGSGHLGLIDHQWSAAYLADNLYIDSDTIILSKNGSITISAASPIINFTSTDAAATTSWSIQQDENTLIITNDKTNATSLIGQDYGFTISNCLYVGTSDTILSTNDIALYVVGKGIITDQVGIGVNSSTSLTANTILTVNGSISIINNTSQLAIIESTTNSSNVQIISFYPLITNSFIGNDQHPWYEGYFTNLLQVGTYTNSAFTGVSISGDGNITVADGNDYAITLSTQANNTSTILLESSSTSILLEADSSDVSIIATGAYPNLQFITTTTNISDWWLGINNQNVFSLNNLATTTLIGNDLGFEITPRLFINQTIIANDNTAYSFYVNGNSCFNGNLIPTLNASDQPVQTLGSSGSQGQRWAAAYIGTDDNYGDDYSPIYWNNGVPTPTRGVIQKKNFTFANGTDTCTLTDNAYRMHDNLHTYVLQIVVTSGEANLPSAISWSSNATDSDNSIVLSTSDEVTGTVVGYILTARGYDLDSLNT